MTKNQILLNQLDKLLSRKKSKKFYAEKLGVSEGEIKHLKRELKKEKNNLPKIPIKPKIISEHQMKVNVDQGTLESTKELDFAPKTHQQLAKLHKIDLSLYKISNYWTKLKSNGKFTSSVFATLKKPQDYSQEDFANFLKNYKSSYTPTTTFPDNTKQIVDIELSLSDYHLAKQYVDGNNDPITRVLQYFRVAEDLVKKTASVYTINKVVFPISNDFFHTDNLHNQTTNGTPQDTILSYDKEYELGFDVLVMTIEMIKNYAKEVKVILVQGNHDRTKSFYVAHALEVYFGKDKNITFDRGHDTVKAITLGNTFIGWHHGNCKIDDLPLLFATHPVYGKMFGDATYREVHTGDKHHYMAKDIKGVRIQQMPSLSGADRWHKDNNFVHSVRAALALVYDDKYGKITEFETRI